YFVGRDPQNLGAHLFSYDPTVGPSSWTDYGVVFPENHTEPAQLYLDLTHIYVSMQERTESHYNHLMVHPIGAGSWTEKIFSDGPATDLAFNVDENDVVWYANRSTDGGVTAKNYWLQNGTAVLVTGTQPTTGPQWRLDLNKYNRISLGGSS